MSFFHWLVMTTAEKGMGVSMIEKESDPIESGEGREGQIKAN